MHEPVAALRPADIEVELGGWVYVISARPAADWMTAIARGAGAILPGMLDAEDRAELLRELLRGAVTRDDIAEAVHDVLEAAGGRRWWEVERLISSVMHSEHWPTIHGELLLRGVDLEKISLGAAWNAFYTLIMRSTEEGKRAGVQFEISKPPPGVGVDELYDEEEAQDAFLSMLSAEQARHGALPSAEAP